ncbi:serine hydrolase [Abiotrophia defectiva]|uniref:serine hydrolase n=1 Tax=Abiotrophia defectiva TaxID=46125 RepID=UPI0028D4D24D|nr:serine hydrolase [Abiotrophia defectiva]
MSSHRQADYSRAVLIILILVAGIAMLGLGFLLYQAMTQSPKEPEVSSSVLVSSQESEASSSLSVASTDSQSVASSQNESLSDKNQAVQSAFSDLYGTKSTKLAYYFQEVTPNSQGTALVSQAAPIKSASIIKLFIMQVLLEEIKAGRLSWQETITMMAEDQVGGTGNLQAAEPGTSYSLEDLALEMLIHSDNTATNLIIERLGGLSAVQAKIQSLGYQDTRLQRVMMDQVAIAEGRENFTSAREVGQLLAKLYQHKLVGQAQDQNFLDFLAQQTDRQGVVATLPQGVISYNKTGTNSAQGLQHDAALVQLTNQSAYVLVVLQEGPGDGDLLKPLQEIGQRVYELMRD